MTIQEFIQTSILKSMNDQVQWLYVEEDGVYKTLWKSLVVHSSRVKENVIFVVI